MSNFSAISWGEQIRFQSDDDVQFEQDQNAYWIFSVCSLKQQSLDYSPPSQSISAVRYLLQANQSQQLDISSKPINLFSYSLMLRV